LFFASPDFQYDQPAEVNAIDLDTNTVTLCDDKKSLSIKLLPKKASRQLRAALITLQVHRGPDAGPLKNLCSGTC
jgi:hypothetical protein